MWRRMLEWVRKSHTYFKQTPAAPDAATTSPPGCTWCGDEVPDGDEAYLEGAPVHLACLRQANQADVLRCTFRAMEQTLARPFAVLLGDATQARGIIEPISSDDATPRMAREILCQLDEFVRHPPLTADIVQRTCAKCALDEAGRQFRAAYLRESVRHVTA